MQTECPHCGKGNPAGNRHCMFCGKPLTDNAEKPSKNVWWKGKATRYALGVLACAGIIVLYIFLCALLGWEHGGGVLPMAMLFGFIAFAWGAITKR